MICEVSAVDGSRVVKELDGATRAAEVERLTASSAVEVADRTNDTNRRQALRDIRAKIKAGTDTAADRSRAIKILIGLALSEKPEANE